ncbi:hypothetical protein [Magnetofaba australis]|uniref:Uncharacterized protein n=1 Tax=Magnetofaba australis IT-1 TaxID=1434232 RepID=A0A1Y2KA68_9PROT|nr:hypothetical protein [Magnetofaba australis]OSM07710.1 hypothetical protein MAIT1_04519 [Magnetofaba australis IT-1]
MPHEHDLRIRIQPGPALRTLLDDLGGSPTALIENIAARYRETCLQELPDITDAEFALFCDLLQATVRDPLTIAALDHELEDGLRQGLAEDFGVDGAALLARCRSWRYAQKLAVTHAVERRLAS